MYVEFPKELMISNSGNGFSYEFHDKPLDILCFKYELTILQNCLTYLQK